MELARVVGQCTATVKEPSLAGQKFALVRRADENGELIGPVEVALDVTGSGPGELVLMVRGSAARQPSQTRQLAADLSIVAIVDELAVGYPPRANTGSAPRRTRARAAGRAS